MAIKKQVLLQVIIGLSAGALGIINFNQGYKSIIVFMNDHNVILTKEAVFDRVFVNTDFINLDYMEGNQVFHFISPFMYYVLAIFWGSFFYLLLKKNYHQLIYSRTNTKKNALKKLMGPFVVNIICFVGVYVGTIFLLIYFKDSLAFRDMLSMLKQSVFFSISSIFISTGLTFLMCFLYLRFNEMIALLIIFMSIILLFFVDLNWKAVSIVFVGEDIYHLGGIIIGIILTIVSYLFLMNTKYEVG